MTGDTFASLGAQQALQEDFARTLMTEGERANPGWAYRDANGRLLMGPCHDPVCSYASKPGGEPHDGKHSWQDGTTGYAHDYGAPCDCEDCGGFA
jgi:hypothetical protein